MNLSWWLWMWKSAAELTEMLECLLCYNLVGLVMKLQWMYVMLQLEHLICPVSISFSVCSSWLNQLFIKRREKLLLQLYVKTNDRVCTVLPGQYCSLLDSNDMQNTSPFLFPCWDTILMWCRHVMSQRIIFHRFLVTNREAAALLGKMLASDL